jgi:putative ABC transport system permease protein
MLGSPASARAKRDDVKRSERIYRWLLRVYPREFRDEYGHEMSLLFRARTAEGPVTLWLQVFSDLLCYAPKEHWSLMKQDLRYAIRTLLRAPGLAATIIATLALGIGATAVIFSAVDAVLLRDAPVADPDTLVDVYTTSGSTAYSRSSYPDYFDLRDSGTFASLAAYTEVPLTLEANDQPEPVAGELVSGNYFEVLGIKIPFGRPFSPDDDRIDSPVRVAVISHALWQRVFNSDRSLIGRTIRLNSNPYTLIGVAPPGFGGPLVEVATDVWIPTALQPEVDPPAAAVRRSRGHSAIFDLRRSRGLRMVGRLPRGGSIDQMTSRAEVVSSRLESAYPNTDRDRRFTLTPLGEGRGLRVATRPILRQLAGAVMLVLLVACMNVASLLLARAISREREVAVQIAMGASRARLARQWLTESVLLGILGSIGALLVTRLSTPLLHAFVIPEAVDLSVNARVLSVTLVVGVGSGLLFGLAPVLQALRPGRTEALRNRGSVANGTHAARMREAFVILQIAVSLVLLVGAGLFVRTLENAYSVEVGYRVDQTLVATVNLQAHGYFEGGSRGAGAGLVLYEQILSRVEALPGVVAASAARMTVLSGNARFTDISTDGRPIESRNALGVRANVVSRRYFETMDIPILQGRSFNAADGPQTTRVTIVTKSLADRIWPNQDPIGKPLRDPANELQVIGVVPDTVYTSTLESDRPPTYYLLLAQNYESAVTLHVRAASNPMALVPAIRDAVRQVDRQVAVERPQLLSAVLDRTLSSQRMMATLVGLFGALALLLAVLGLYGVMAHAATQRTPEIGIRLAMGAQPCSVVSLLLRQGLRLLGIGAAIGLTGALMGTRYIEAQLFGVTPTDLLTFIVGCVALAIAGLTASVIPALRAMRVDPASALRRT